MNRTMFNERVLKLLWDSLWPLLSKGLTVTIPLTLASFTLGLALAMVTAFVQVARVPVLRRIARFYIWVFRGTPMIVQLFIVFYGLPGLGLTLDAIPSAIVVFSLNTGAYAAETVRAAMEAEKPDVVLCIGQAGGRFGLTPERVAINIDDARIPDNEGNQPLDSAIFEDGAPAYFTSLPVKAIREAGIPSSLSYTAGTYVCNHLMYGVLYHIAKSYPEMRGGFMHVPFLHEQIMNRPNTPSLSKEDIVRGIEAAVEAIVKNGQHASHVMGHTH